MNGQDLLLSLSHIDRKFIEESEMDMISEQKLIYKQPQQGRKRIRRPMLLAAMIGLLLFLAGCGAVIYLTLAEEPWASIPRLEERDISREDIQITVTSVSPTGLAYNCDVVGLGMEEKSVFL